MFMFPKKTKHHATSIKFDTIIGNTTTIEGNLYLTGNIRVDGKLNGSIYSNKGHDITVAIGDKGFIKGNIECDHLVTSGTIIGNVQASNKVEILDRAKIEGDISYKLLSMDSGATIQGHFSCQLSQTDLDSKGLAQVAIQQAQERTSS